VTVEQWGTIVAILAAFAAVGRTMFVTESRVETLKEQKGALETRVRDLETKLADLNTKVVADERDFHALRSSVGAADLRVQSMFTEIKAEMREGFRILNAHLNAVLGETTNPGEHRG
jgi:predicted  nucleic acid-binding Zn-ribbon protein